MRNHSVGPDAQFAGDPARLPATTFGATMPGPTATGRLLTLEYPLRTPD